MLGLSFSKLLLIVLVIVVAWRGLRIMNQVQSRLAQRDAQAGGARPRAHQPTPKATDLVECPRCGMFVPNGTFCPSVEQCRFRRAS
jgi:hypothetical protein